MKNDIFLYNIMQFLNSKEVFYAFYKNNDVWKILLKRDYDIEIYMNNNFDEYFYQSWLDIIEYKKILFLPIKWIEKNIISINFNYLCKYIDIYEDFIKKYENDIYWDCLSENQSLNKNIIEKYKDKLDRKILSENYNIDVNFIKKYKKYINFESLSENKYINV